MESKQDISINIQSEMEKTFVSCFYHELFNLLGHLAYKTGFR
jgi:hypothetical protein